MSETTVGRLARKYGLSRSTLLYYDTIGLLSPSLRQKGEYRCYSEDDEHRLKQICTYRAAGIPLKEIRELLDSPETSFTAILEHRFADLNTEIRKLYEQQRIITGLLRNSAKILESHVMNKALWTSLLQQAGFSEQDMRTWHVTFEQTDPEKHRLFLQHLHISDEEITAIRGWARGTSG